MNFADLLDALDAAVLPREFTKIIREKIDHIEAQLDVARAAEQEKELGAAVDVSSDFLYAVFDQRDMLDRPNRKWYSPNTTLGDRSGGSRRTRKRGLCFHHTAVNGGFGADAWLVKKYRQLGASTMDVSRFAELSRELTVDEWSRAMALAHRYRGDPPRKFNEGVPYHAIMGPNSVLYLNLPFEFVTWHGNGSNNDFIGVGWDALSTAESPAAKDLLADAAYLVDLARDEGHDVVDVTCHCAWTNKPSDPGAEFIESVIVPLSESRNLVIDWDFKTNGAKSLRAVMESAGRSTSAT